ncbi:hypothetical protein F3J14_04165 [Burkholderia sp. Tr-862]|uniref:hypothetical protein n=1 Tax=Burkholderia sp. Tr-862 TaxID=2608331 RepID=UPI00141A57DA|nr:hypothetical protein [Burkholderia sp. Tr-862]NIF40107.1 hypothetical protein [Burkholderia sp. Tr-862]
MTKTTYPNTLLQPTQIIDFLLSNGTRVRAVLTPRPDASRTSVANVDLEYTNAGSAMLVPVPNQGQPRSVLQAGAQAYQIAQREAQRSGLNIDGVQLEGEEFLEVADVEQITANTIPVTKV